MLGGDAIGSGLPEMLYATVDLERKVSAGERKCFAAVNNLVSRYKV
jgi:hypothetical protein